MTILPRLLGLGLLSLLVGLLLAACETTKHGAGENSTPGYGAEAVTTSRQIAQVGGANVEFKTPQSDLAAAFIRQFGDGTVVDKVQVYPAPAGPKEKAAYYLVGMGLRNGMFRAMALPLVSADDNTVYLSPAAERYVLTGVGCTACFFDFEGNRIVGSTCDGNQGGGRCDFKRETGNTLFGTR